MNRIALVTGANKGLGFETCRRLAGLGYHVLLTARDRKRGEEAASRLKDAGRVTFLPLDTTDPGSIAEAAGFVDRTFGRLDALVNNAGILPRESGRNSAFDARRDDLRAAMETNTYGAFELCQRLIPLMRRHGYGRVVNVSSGMGQLSDMNAGYAAYRLSKTALNAVTRVFAAETAGQNILVNSICPGWVKTDMGGPGAHRTVEEGAEGIVWAATLPDGGPTGGFFRDRKPLPW